MVGGSGTVPTVTAVQPEPLAGIDEISDRFVARYAALDPVLATILGIAGDDGRLTDYSPDGCAQRAEAARAALAEIEPVEPADLRQRLAKAVFTERVGLMVELYDAGLVVGALNVIASSVQNTRQAFDLMPATSVQAWETIAARLAAVPEAVAGIQAGLAYAADAGRCPVLRQVEKVAQQCQTWADATDDGSYFHQLVRPAAEVDGIGDTLLRELGDRATAATDAFAELAAYLRQGLAPRAPAKDAVGPDVYELCSRDFLGAKIDLIEAYEWGWAEFFRVESEMKLVADRIKPGASLAEAAMALDADERYQVAGRHEFERWLQELSDAALAQLRDVHFDIPDPLMELECKIAPPGGPVGASYTGPSEDFARPGCMWWSVPSGRERFSTWREVTAVYHEGVPGHHLQIATAVYVADTLNLFQRQFSWVSGHGEGWALYAERVMHELGYFTDDGNLLGMLEGSLFRAARVIVDIGMHLELPIPAGSGFHPGERWTPQLGLEFLLTRTISDPPHVYDEIDRYLGWPGQAPSYKLGERLWLSAREDARRRSTNGFDSKAFHTAALRMGSMGLDTLRQQLAVL
jgi:uncharacterized protein (DUF885 family)